MAEMQPSYDVVTLGETMLRLTPPGMRRIEQAVSFDIEVGGSESNTAVGLVRLGMKVAWLSRLTNNSLGRLIANTIGGYGVDTSGVVWTDHDRVGTYFLEEGKAPRGSTIIYDRANSAISRMQPSELPADLFQPNQAKLLHLTGITVALGPDAAATCQTALKLAKAAGWRFSFDLNYRSRLWTPAAAAAGCELFAQAADLLITPLGDARLIYGLAAQLTAEKVLEELAARYSQATIVVTLGKDGALGREPQGQIIHQPTFPAEEVGRIGGGDAFAAGLLYGYLQAPPTGSSKGLATALRWGAAVAALKYTIPGDFPLIDRAEVLRLMEQDNTKPTVNR